MIYKLIKPYKFLLFWFFIIETIASASPLILPILLKQIIDLIIPSKNPTLLLNYIYLIILLFIIIVITSILTSILSEYLSQKIIMTFNYNILYHIKRLELSFYHQKKHGEIINRVIRDSELVGRFVTGEVIPAIKSFIYCFFVIIFMAYLNAKITIIVFLAIPFYFFIYTGISKKFNDNIVKLANAKDLLMNYVTQLLNGIFIVKIFCNEKLEDEKYLKLSEENAIQSVKVMSLKTISDNLAILFSLILSYGFFIYSIILIWENKITIGSSLAIFSYLGMILNPIERITMLFRDYRQANVSYKRINEYLSIPLYTEDNDVKYSIKNFSSSIKFDNVCFSYENRKKLFNKINLTITKGQKIGIVGHSGVGKSSLILLLTKLFKCTSGDILIDGINIKQIPSHDLLKIISIVPQETFLFNASIKENLLYSNPLASDDELINACVLSNIHYFIMNLPDKYNTEVGERGLKFSGGEKQRIAIARAILRNPEILIFDEATSHLDAENEIIIKETIEHITKNKTSIIITHRLNMVTNCDKIYILENGSVVEEGTHQDLINSKKIYYHMWEKQAKSKIK